MRNLKIYNKLTSNGYKHGRHTENSNDTLQKEVDVAGEHDAVQDPRITSHEKTRIRNWSRCVLIKWKRKEIQDIGQSMGNQKVSEGQGQQDILDETRRRSGSFERTLASECCWIQIIHQS